MRNHRVPIFVFALLATLIPQRGFSRALVEAGLGPIYYQGEGAQGNWFNPAVALGIDLIQNDTFRMTLMGEYHYSQSETQSFQFLSPALRLYHWRQSFRYYLEVGASLTVFSRNPIPGSTLMFTQIGGESLLVGRFDLGFSITGACLLNNSTFGSAGPYMSWLEGHVYLQFSLPTGRDN